MVIGKYNQTGGSNDTTLMGRPSEIWVDPADNEVFVADGYGNRRVIVFDGASGEYLRHWGAYGKRPDDPPPRPARPPRHGAPTTARRRGSRGRHRRNCASRTASPARVMASSTSPTAANNRIQVFRQNGEFVREKILRAHCGGEEQADVGPEAAVWHRGRVLGRLLARRAPDVSLRGRRRHARHHRAAPERPGGRGRVRGPGLAPGQLGRPHNLTVDPAGNIFVAEAAGPEAKDPRSGAMRPTGYRAQKFRFSGTR